MLSNEHTRKLLALAVLALCGGQSVAHAAIARATGQSGALCTPYLATDFGFGHDIGGLYWRQPVGSHVAVCPVNLGYISISPTPTGGVTLYYTDASSTKPFSCTFIERFADGSVAPSVTKYTCSTAGGCVGSTTPTSYTGEGYLQWQGSDFGADQMNVDSSIALRCEGTNGDVIRAYSTYFFDIQDPG